jgi:formiminotetrahydrofolate cyclodeaminase
MTITTKTINELLTSLAAKQPTPGGGTVAGILAALSSSLGQMVLAYTQGKSKYKEHEKLHSDCSNFLRAASNEAILLAEEDIKAYKALNSLWKLEKDNPQRVASWDATLDRAIEVPMKTMELSNRILITLQTLVGKTNAMLSSDLVIAAILAESTARAASLNVEINLQQLAKGEHRDTLQTQTVAMLADCKTICKSIEDACRV